MSTEMFYHPHTRHPTRAYRPVLKHLRDCLVSRMTYDEIRDCLNSAGLRTGTGRLWTSSAVGGVLHRIRHRTGHHFFALCELVFDQELSRDDANVILNLH